MNSQTPTAIVRCCFLLVIAVSLVSIPNQFAWSQAAKVDDVKEYKTAKPTHREAENWWRERHQRKKMLKDSMDRVDLVFIGDSITHSFENAGKESWDKYYGNRNALNLGFSGDRTEHVIWRLNHGEIDAISPRLVVLMIGTNNTGHNMDAPGNTAKGIEEIIAILKRKLPRTKILLLAIFPRDERARSPKRKNNDAINEIISKFSDGEVVFYQDINQHFLTEDGILSKEIMPDLLHPNAKGYAIWAEAMEPKVKELMGQ